MVTKRDRLTLNEAARYAHARAGSLREEDIASLERLRAELGLAQRAIDERLGRSANWYANHSRGNGEHVFSRADLVRVRDLLVLEYLREVSGVGEHDISRGVNRPRGWYAEQLGSGFNVRDFATVFSFLVAAVVLEHDLGGVSDEQLARVVELGVIDDALVDEVRSAVDVDYPAR